MHDRPGSHGDQKQPKPTSSVAFTVGMLAAAVGLALATFAGLSGGMGFLIGFVSGFVLAAGLLTYPELSNRNGASISIHPNGDTCDACGAALRKPEADVG